MAKRASPNVEPIRTLDELAKLVGRNKGTVSRWIGKPEWTFGRPPWKRSLVPDVLRWAAAHLRDRSDTESPPTADATGKPTPTSAAKTTGALINLKEKKLAAEVRKLEAHAATAETALARERGQLLDAAEVEIRWGRTGASIREGFENLPSQLVGLALNHGMPQQAAPAYHAQVTAAVAAVLQRLSDDAATEVEDDEDRAAEAAQ